MTGMALAGRERDPSPAAKDSLTSLLEAAIEAVTKNDAPALQRMAASLTHPAAEAAVYFRGPFSRLQLEEAGTRLRVLAALLEATERNLRLWRRVLRTSDRAAYGSMHR